MQGKTLTFVFHSINEFSNSREKIFFQVISLSLDSSITNKEECSTNWNPFTFSDTETDSGKMSFILRQ